MFLQLLVITDVDEVTSITDIGEAFGVAEVISVLLYWGSLIIRFR